MNVNVGTFDRAVRIFVGLLALALVFVGPQTPWGLLGLIPLATGFLGYCPVYRVLGFSTCPLDRGGRGRGHKPAH